MFLHTFDVMGYFGPTIICIFPYIYVQLASSFISMFFIHAVARGLCACAFTLFGSFSVCFVPYPGSGGELCLLTLALFDLGE